MAVDVCYRSYLLTMLPFPRILLFVLSILSVLGSTGCDLTAPTTVVTSHIPEVQGLLSFHEGDVYYYAHSSIDTIEMWKGGKVDYEEIRPLVRDSSMEHVSYVIGNRVQFERYYQLIVLTDVVFEQRSLSIGLDSLPVFDTRPAVQDTFAVDTFSGGGSIVRRLRSRDTLVYSQLNAAMVHAACFEEITDNGSGSTSRDHRRTFIVPQGHIIRVESWREYTNPSSNAAFHRDHHVQELYRIVRSL